MRCHFLIMSINCWYLWIFWRTCSRSCPQSQGAWTLSFDVYWALCQSAILSHFLEISEVSSVIPLLLSLQCQYTAGTTFWSQDFWFWPCQRGHRRHGYRQTDACDTKWIREGVRISCLLTWGILYRRISVQHQDRHLQFWNCERPGSLNY